MPTDSRKNKIKFLLWSYLFLLIIEGALRKWFLPFLSTPLLLVRDPIALLALFWAWPLLEKSIYWFRIQILFFIGLVGIVLALYVGHGDWLTALYGLRIYLIQLPLIFVFPLIFSRKDVIRAMWATILISIPMVILLAAQSSTPPSHPLNVGTGGTGSSAFSGAAGKFRPSAIFSFTNLVSRFFTFSAASLLAVVYGLASATSANEPITKYRNQSIIGKRVTLFFGVLSLIIALPVSISRSLMVSYAIVFIVTVLILISTKEKIASLITTFIIVYLLATAALNIPLVKEASDAFAVRWALAAQAESDEAVGGDEDNSGLFGSLSKRVFKQFTAPLVHADSYKLLGRGIGMGSNIGAVRLSGKQGFLLDESSWGKQMGELGLFIGPIFIFWRISLSYHLLKIALKEAYHSNNRITIILTTASLMGILNGQLGQSAGLGFIVATTGLALASSVKDDAEIKLN